MKQIKEYRRIVGMNFIHKKTGRLYQVSQLAYRESDLEIMVIYHDEDMVHWVRPASEFMDGRFVLA